MIDFKSVKVITAIVLISAIVSGTVWLWKEKEFYKSENKRQSENMSWQRKYDSLKFSNQILSSNEIKEHLTYSDPELKKKIEAANIKIGRIESMFSNAYKFRDTTKKETDISAMVEAVKNSIPSQQSWSDTTECLKIKGIVSYDGEKLKVVVQDREFKNKSDAVAYWQRRQWSFLGIKTRFLGKKEFTAKTFDNCGESRIMVIEKKK